VAGLKKQESGILVKVFFYSLLFLKLRFKKGSQNTVAMRHQMFDNSKKWKKKTQD
jgi:hypothetical protein